MKTFTFLLLLVSSSAKAQTAEDILKQCAQTIKALKNISYNIFHENSGEKITADVTIKRGNEQPIFDVSMIKVAGLVIDNNGSKQITYAYNGDHFDFVDINTNETVRLDSPNYNKLSRTRLMPYMGVALAPYWQKEPFGILLKQMTSASILGDSTIYGEECYKIKIVGESNSQLAGKYTFESTWFVGKTDKLIHGSISRVDKQFLKIRSVDQNLEKSFFDLTSSTELKKITGTEPFADGLLAIGTKAPNWSLPSSRNETITLEKLQGKVVLLDFWGTWCVPCIKAMPDIQAVYNTFKNQEVEVIGVSVEMEKVTNPIDFMKKRGFTYPIVLDGNKITKAYKVQQFPSLYIIDKKGTIVHAEYGGNRETFKEDLINRILKALKE